MSEWRPWQDVACFVMGAVWLALYIPHAAWSVEVVPQWGRLSAELSAVALAIWGGIRRDRDRPTTWI